MNGAQAYSDLIQRIVKANRLRSCSSLLGWDKETYMPGRGSGHRAEQLALLAGLAHEMWTSPAIGDLLEACRGWEGAADPDGTQAVNLREIEREYRKKTRLQTSFVEQMTRATTLAHPAWVQARKDSNFALFRPHLEGIVKFKREEAQAYGYEENPYDALLDNYEPNTTTRQVTELFSKLKAGLRTLLDQVAAAPKRPDVSILQRHYPAQMQKQFGQAAAAAIGFDFSAGRLDEVVHPFCTGIGPGDTRITTRYNENFFNEAFFGILHEAGHGLYEQNLPAEHWGAPCGQAAWMATHESQSRLWENFVGRGPSYWRGLFPAAQKTFSGALSDVKARDFIHAINQVQPSFIRVEADEATYNLHIILRFEMEQELIGGRLAVADVPQAWNERFEKMLGLKVTNDRLGCLQDIHWSFGGIGYFPTYSMGNLYAAQFFDQARIELPGLEEGFADGKFSDLLQWLKERIYSQGRRFTAPRLVERLTGRGLSVQPLLDHLHAKYSELYGF